MLFKENNFENKLKIIRVVKEKEGIVQIHYSIKIILFVW